MLYLYPRVITPVLDFSIFLFDGNLLSGDGYNRIYNSVSQLVAVSNSTTGLLVRGKEL